MPQFINFDGWWIVNADRITHLMQGEAGRWFMAVDGVPGPIPLTRKIVDQLIPLLGAAKVVGLPPVGEQARAAMGPEPKSKKKPAATPAST